MKKEISIAPMIDISTVYFRQLMRILSKNTKIYTEMLSAASISKPSFDPKAYYIHHNEHPIIAQLGGSDPISLSKSAEILQSLGYSEINLNCGCPSCKVKEGSFGACLMLNPDHVRQICHEMKKVLTVPLTVKCRLGVDDHDSYEHVFQFIDTVNKAGINEFIIHARKAFLNGLSPAENRTVPPLKYDWVYQLQSDFPQIRFHINGGINNHIQIQENLERGLGVMIGRLSYEDPWFFRNIDSLYFNSDDSVFSRRELMESYSFACEEIQSNVGKSNKTLMSKPIVNLFKNQKGNSKYRNEFNKLCQDKNLTFTQVIDSIIEIMDSINPESLDNIPKVDNSEIVNKIE